MTKITVTLPNLVREMRWIALAFGLAFGINIYAIYTFRTPWHELVTSLPWVLAISALIYGLTCLVRLVIYLVRRLGKTLSPVIKRDPS